MEKFYQYLDIEQRKYLSLNFLFSEKITVDGFVSELDIKYTERKAKSEIHKNGEFFCMLFNKHISRYISNIDQYPIQQI
jgi:hypothetical protein